MECRNSSFSIEKNLPLLSMSSFFDLEIKLRALYMLGK
jgi:hypothetical protein